MPGTVRPFAVELGDDVMEGIAADEAQKEFALGGGKRVPVQGEEIALRDERHETQMKLRGGRLDAETGVRETARDVRCDRGMRVFLGVVTRDLARLHARFGEQLIEKDARS